MIFSMAVRRHYNDILPERMKIHITKYLLGLNSAGFVGTLQPQFVFRSIQAYRMNRFFAWVPSSTSPSVFFIDLM